MRVRVGSILFALAIVVVACGGSETPGKTPSGARASCASDSDCVVSDHSDCCQSCPTEPFGMPQLRSEQLKNKCADKSCPERSDRIECPKVQPVAGFVAYCKEGTCAVKK
jgi:hypothetical protein